MKSYFWLPSARHIRSPNFNYRPENTEIDCIVIHGISLPEGHFMGDDISSLFTNCLDPKAHPDYEDLSKLRVSSHFLIRRDGELIQFVATNERAWHAGESELCGIKGCNDFSIGVELEGTDYIPYTEMQYQKLTHLIKELKQYYPKISNERIIGHCDIAPERKTDPGPVFNWQQLFSLLTTGDR
ncbi:MAG: 1,6-anhydro-N-acetylmuramyl-L-alanine amidase AmpD [Gammaproteobacteria bacterium]|nr:1,6-anhydro-N-acetylmuramyl-L-alanine amidase AmpD [Gammaproteobacteria bacterium]